MYITDEQKRILLEHLPRAAELIAKGSVYELELALDEQITEHEMDDQFELTEVGLTLQMLYDQIHDQNP